MRRAEDSAPYPLTLAVKPVKLKLTVAYDGSNYAGWQVQKTGSASSKRSKKRSLSCSLLFAVFTVPAGRIPAFMRLAWLRTWRFRRMNSKCPSQSGSRAERFLPEDIRILSATRSGEQFHARFDASGKQYRYFVWNHTAMNPCSAITHGKFLTDWI